MTNELCNNPTNNATNDEQADILLCHGEIATPSGFLFVDTSAGLSYGTDTMYH